MVIKRSAMLWVALACTAGASAQTHDWPMPGRDVQRSNYTPERLGAYVHYPRWQFRWTWRSPSPISWRAQVVAAEGIVAVGTFDGKLHAIDFQTGREKWTFETGGPLTRGPAFGDSALPRDAKRPPRVKGGPILHSPAIADGKVFCTSHDGGIYCVDAASGERIWSYRTGKGIVASPLVYDGAVAVGSKDGFFYALNTEDGKVLWKCQVGEPIVVSASMSESAGMIFTGTSHMNAVAINARTGKVAWKRKLKGQSLQEAWPQVSEKHGVVIYRAHSVYSMWNNIGHAGNGHAEDPKLARLQGVFKDKPPADIDEEQDGISEYLIRNPHRRTFWALDLKTGRDRYPKPVPVLYAWGISATMNAQVIDNHTDRCWVMWRTRATKGSASEYPDLGALDLATGRFTEHPPWIYKGGHMQNGLWGGDEPWPISGAADAIFMTQNHGPNGWYLTNRTSFCVIAENVWQVWKNNRSDKPPTPQQRYAWPPRWKRNVVSCIYTRRRLLWAHGSGIGCFEAPERSGGK